jgi:hypothetical protein
MYRTAEEKRESGAYKAAGLEDLESRSPLSFRNSESFLSFYLENLRENAFVDICDFEIIERRSRFKKPLVRLKRLIWAMLRFYTYRLWSQQNQINGLLLAAAEGIHEQQIEKINSLENRVRALEDALRQADG